MRHVETAHDPVGIIVTVTVMIAIGAFIWQRWISPPPPTKAQLYDMCVKNADKLYALDRHAVATGGADSVTQEYYYQVAEKTHELGLQDCVKQN